MTIKRVLVIADDFTGAAEIGGIGVQHGMSAHIVRAGSVSDRDADLLVIDTDTRDHTSIEAAARVGEILGSCDVGAFDLVYKKTDSVLRGPVAAELDAIRCALRLDRVVLAPQNPTLGRVIRNGQYFIHDVRLDQTDFARDPEHPRRSADVRELLGQPSERVTIVAGESREDLASVARQIDRSCLPAGGADFFRAVLGARGRARNVDAMVPPTSSNQLFVCGSASGSSRWAVTDAAARGAAVVPMPRELFESLNADDRVIQRWAEQVVDAIRKRGTAVMAVAQPAVPDRTGPVRQLIAATVARVMSMHRPAVLWLEGGATAAAVVERMNWRGFDVEGTLAAGVVALRTAEQTPQRLILKPGSYAWPPGVL